MTNLVGYGHFRRRRVRSAALAVGVCVILAGAALGKPDAPATSAATQRLFDAISGNNLGAAKTALAAGADLAGRNGAGLTPIEAANRRGRYEIAHFLLVEKNGRGAVRAAPAAEPVRAAGPFDPTRPPATALPVIGAVREPTAAASVPAPSKPVAGAAPPKVEAVKAPPSAGSSSKGWLGQVLDAIWSSPSGATSVAATMLPGPEAPNAEMLPPRTASESPSWTSPPLTDEIVEPASSGLFAMLFGLLATADTPASATETVATPAASMPGPLPKLAAPKPAAQALAPRIVEPARLAQAQPRPVPLARTPSTDVATLDSQSGPVAPIRAPEAPAVVSVASRPAAEGTPTKPDGATTVGPEAATIPEPASDSQGLWARIIDFFASPNASVAPQVATIGAFDHVTGTSGATASPAADPRIAEIGEFGRIFGRLDATTSPVSVATAAAPRTEIVAQATGVRVSDISVFDRFFGWLSAMAQPAFAEAPERLPIAGRTPTPRVSAQPRREPSQTTVAPTLAGAKDKNAPIEIANLPPTTDTDVPALSTAGQPLLGVELMLGTSVGLDAVLAAGRGRRDPGSRGPCIRKRDGKIAYCIETIDWPAGIGTHFDVSTVLFQGPRAVVRYDDGKSTTIYTQYSTEAFESVVAHYRDRIGEPTETWTRRVAPMAAERRPNPTQVWRSRDPKTGETTVLEVRRYDDTRGGFPDLRHGAIMLYRGGAEPLFPRLSTLELMSLR